MPVVHRGRRPKDLAKAIGSRKAFGVGFRRGRRHHRRRR
jgi:hypothetical protein